MPKYKFARCTYLSFPRKVNLLAKPVQFKPEELIARAYADRLILGKLTQMHEAIKLSEIADDLQSQGLGLAAIRSLLASNPDKFSYNERRWIPTSRIEGLGRPFHEAVRLTVDRFGGPMPFDLLVAEISHARHMELDDAEAQVKRLVEIDRDVFVTNNGFAVLTAWVFHTTDETIERALSLHNLTQEQLDEAVAKIGKIDFREPDAMEKALKAAAPISAKLLGAVAWLQLNPQSAHAPQLYHWRTFNAALLSVPGYLYGAEGLLSPAEDAKKWITAAVKLADRIAPLVEIEDAQPIEIKAEDIAKMVKKIASSDDTVTATKLLEDNYEITPSVKTFPDDLANIMEGMRANPGVWWVGGDRFRKPNSAPDFIETVPELFQYQYSDQKDEDGEYVDIELTDEGLSSTLRKLLHHPLATDVLDEDLLPVPKQMPEVVRCVLKPIHREVGTFPICQFPNGFFDAEPKIQEMVFVDPTGRELQVWANQEARLLFNLIDWFYEQPIESGAVFSVASTPKPNIFEFSWLDQTDPVVFITSQRMEELREIQAESESVSTLDLLQRVMTHWPKGADFLTILWELNVIRRTPRRLVASLLSSYACFYQRSGSPLWHYDAKKVDQGFDKTKRKFMIKR